MNSQQKLKLAIMLRAKMFDDEIVIEPAAMTDGSVVDKDYHELEESHEGPVQDARNEVREGQVETGLPTDYSRHFEAKSVAAKMHDGSWIGWTFWYGGGKHAEPEAIDWMEESYDLDCKEEEKTVTVQTFTKTEAATK